MEVIRSKRKTIALEITRDGRTVVRAPLRATDQMIEQFVHQHEQWLQTHLEKSKQRLQKHPEPSKEEIEILRRKAKQILPQKVGYYGNIMGLHPTAIHITSAKTRFGSCSAENSISFSLYLMQYPEEAIDYVVVHELAHIQEHNHGTRFYKLIESVLPDYKERRKLFRD